MLAGPLVWYTLHGSGVRIFPFLHDNSNDSCSSDLDGQRPLLSRRRGRQSARRALAGRVRPMAADLFRSDLSARPRAGHGVSASWARKRATASPSSARIAGSGPSPTLPRWPSARPTCPSIPRSPASRSRSWCATPAAASPSSPRASSSTSSHSVRGQTQLERIVMMDSPAPEGAIAFSALLDDADARGAERDPVFDALAHSVEPARSGHADLHLRHHRRAQGRCPHPRQHRRQPELRRPSISTSTPPTPASPFCPSRTSPPAPSITSCTTHGAQVAYCSQFDKLPQAMREIRPTVIVGVPRVFEKIRQEVERRAAQSPIKKRLLAWAIRLGSQLCRYRLRRPQALLAAVEAGQQAGLFQGSRGLRRPRAHLRLRRRAAGHRHRALVRLGRHRALGGIRPHRNLAGHRPQHAHPSPHGRGRHAPEQCRAEARRGRRAAGSRPSVFAGYWQKPAATAECFRQPGMVPHRRHRPHRRRRIPLTSPTARRNC